MDRIARIRSAIMADPANQVYTQAGIEPLFVAPPTARLLIVGQAPGLKAQEAGRVWDDASGDRLRHWLGLDRDRFYNRQDVAILPMDFYYPGKGRTGDLPPRAGFAAQWHPALLETMPAIELTLLVGRYAQAYYLGTRRLKTLTETVAQYQDYLPQYWPLVHPSPLNQRWLARNSWFEADVVPALQERVWQLLRQ